jgi:hypothetical protein
MADTISHRRSGISSSRFPTCPYSVSARLREYRVVDVLDDYWKGEFIDEKQGMKWATAFYCLRFWEATLGVGA